MTYQLSYLFNENLNYIYLPEGWGVVDIQKGFWLNGDGIPTKGGDAVCWIPPSALRLLTKYEEI